MTLEQYKKQVSAIHEASQSFDGTPEEAVKFFEDLAKKYPEACEFNAKAMEAKDLAEFKSLANSFGMEFSSDESAEKLFTMLQDGKKQLEELALRYEDGTELSDDSLAAVSACGLGAGLWSAWQAEVISMFSPLLAAYVFVTDSLDYGLERGCYKARRVFTRAIPNVLADTIRAFRE